MAYTLISCGRTQFAVDWGVVERFCKSYWFAYYQDQYSNLIRISESSWYNPFSWKMPDILNVDFEWPRIHAATREQTARDLSDYQRRAAYDMPGVAREVLDRLERTAYLKRSMTAWLREIQNTNISAMQKSERDYDGLIDACRFVRDTSADVVAIGSTIATGGAAVGLLGASSALKGVYKYQDTGKAGAAVLYGTGSLVLGAFKIRGAKLTSGGEYALVLAQGALETTTSLASGKSFGDAIAAGGLKVVGAGASQALFGAGVVKKVFEKMPIPFNVYSETWRKGVEYTSVDIADELLAKTSKKLVEKGVKAGTSFVASQIVATPPRVAQPAVTGSTFMDDVPVEQLGLLYFSIVNMDRGIGHGW